jgi:alpha(1,3/1,4) fucosyltransferase
MRIGITVPVQFSVFSGGSAGAAMAVGEVLRSQGHEVIFVNVVGSLEDHKKWWDDCQSLKDNWQVVHLQESGLRVDVLFEMGGLCPSKEERKRVATTNIWLLRKPVLLSEVENSIFPLTTTKRNLEGIDQVWCFDTEVTNDDLQYLEALCRCPARTVPFVWSPTPVLIHQAEIRMPTWLQITATAIQQAGKVLPWSVHIPETNTSGSSSCTIPLVGLYEAKRNGFPVTKFKVHNADHIQRSEFFRQNIWKHTEIADLSGEFLGRQRVIDMTVEPMSMLFSHLRFRQIRPYLLDAAWAGVPLVHNSPLLRDLSGTGLEHGYYPENSITGMVKAVAKIHEDLATAQGIFKPNGLAVIQEAITRRWTPVAHGVQAGWKTALATLTPSSTPVAAAPVVAPAAAPVNAAKPENTFLVLFTDMWDSFNPAHNMFTLMLEEAAKNFEKKVQIQGVDEGSLGGRKPNCILFGPFGSGWKKPEYKEIPKIHYTGENTEPIAGEKVFLNLGYQHADFMDERYIRLPLWMLEIDWFGADMEQIRNPKPLPVDRVTQVYPEEISEKKKFCAFVVTNPTNPIRNNAFHALSQYKRVDSAGRLFNNIGNELFSEMGGGGGGELKKLEFLKHYKFCLAYENASSQGYTTEKYLHAKAAGCIPIYWGDPKFERDFDPAGCIDAREITSPEQLIAAVKKIDENPSLYLKAFAIPALDEYHRDLVRRTMSHVARLILKGGGVQESELARIPKMIGATSTAEAEQMAKGRPQQPRVENVTEMPVSTTAPQQMKTPFVVTMANSRFLPSLLTFLSGMAKQVSAVPDLRARVWLGKDVTEDSKKLLIGNYPFAEFRTLPETEFQVPGFPDFWAPEHYAWKLWIFQNTVNDESLRNHLVLYLDAGIFMCRWPVKWLLTAQEKGMCVLEDPRETNDRWCHMTFQTKLSMTASELGAHQIVAGCQAFIAGHPLPTQIFNAALELGKQRDLIVGAKWEGVRAVDGKPFGHRHDQSILSLLTLRSRCPTFPLDELYCDTSLRDTFQKGKYLYVHRGNFRLHQPFAKHIDEAHVINLERRADRLEKLWTNCPSLKGRVQRLPAVEGKKLQLTPALARLFKPHDFFWKKAIMGCALSHLSLWWKLVNEHPDIQSFLIMEDDVKFQDGWEKRWEEAANYLPENYDVVYLGGILPPNRQGFEHLKEKVNPYFSRVAENTMFGQKAPNRYFHFCAYAYVLSRRGAEKIFELMNAHDGYWTSADHMICNEVTKMDLYFLDPLVAGCYQDDDPKYQASAFNDFSRIDQFDSDLWNNDERFTQQEIQAAMEKAEKEINIKVVLGDCEGARGSESTAAAAAAAVPVAKPDLPSVLRLLKEWKADTWNQATQVETLERAVPFLKRSADPYSDPPVSEIQAALTSWKLQERPNPLWKTVLHSLESWTSCPVLARSPPTPAKRRLVCLEDHKLKEEDIYESKWFKELFGKDLPMIFEQISPFSEPPSDSPIVCLQKPFVEEYTALLKRWTAAGKTFYILHMSDEHLNDTIEAYSLDGCLGVVRTYARSDIPSSVASKVLTVPLGYHWTLIHGSDNPYEKTPRLPFRNYKWSFIGTGWGTREALFAPFQTLDPHRLVLLDSWDSPKKVGRDEYISTMLDSYFVLCPPGNNPESFRIYEALECGCIPIYIKSPGDDKLIETLMNEIGLLPASSWQEGLVLLQHLLNNIELLENYRRTILTRWVGYKGRLGAEARKRLGI